MRLVLNDIKGETHIVPIDRDEIVSGRLPTNDVVLDGTFVSRQHTKFYMKGTLLFVQDMGKRLKLK